MSDLSAPLSQLTDDELDALLRDEPPTLEELFELRARADVMEIAYREASSEYAKALNRFNAAARERGRRLLRSTLSEGEWQQLQVAGYLEVASRLCPPPGGVYRIPSTGGQVILHQRTRRGTVSKRPYVRLCLVPWGGGLPGTDLVLMHKLLIESDEETYLRTANQFPRRKLPVGDPRVHGS